MRKLIPLVLLIASSAYAREDLGWLKAPRSVMASADFASLTPGCYASGSVVGPFVVTVSRAGTASYVTNAGGLADCGANTFRVNGWGLIGEAARGPNLYATPESPAGQTIAIGATGYYTASVLGSGSQTLSPGGLTATGLPCTVRQGYPCTFNVTVTGNLTVSAVTGSLTFGQVEAGQWETSPIRSGSRNAEFVTLTPMGLTRGDLFCVAADVVIQGAARAWATGNATILQPGPTSGANRGYVTGSYWSINDGSNVQKYISVTVPQTQAVSRIVACSTSGTLTFSTNGTDRSGGVTGAGAGTWSVPPASISIGGSATAGAWYVRNIRLCQGAAAAVKCSAEVGSSTAVAAVGDSLTVGGSGGSTVPYPQHLTHALGPPRAVWNWGVNGYRTDQCRAVFDARVPGRYGTVIILCGINDVSQGYDTGNIYSRLESMYDAARSSGLKLVAVTILPARGTVWWSEPATRTLVEGINAQILAYCAAHSSDTTCVDAYAAFNDAGNPGALLAAYDGGDHLHLNQAGTDYLGQLIRAALP